MRGGRGGGLLIASVEWRTEDVRRPLDEEQLAQDDIEALRRWVREGAVWVAE